MKNIFLKETDKPSYLFIIDKSKMFVPEAPYLSYSTVGGRVHKTEGSDIYRPQFIYITNEEKFKKDEWVTDGIEVIKASSKVVDAQGLVNRRDWRKVVLTNDTSLIEDGVQEVSSSFLSFYAENTPDYVEIFETKVYNETLQDYAGSLYSYKFPQKEEIKTEENVIDQWLEKNGNPEIMKQVEREAEELELQHYAKKYYNNFDKRKEEFAFLDGARWQAERMYSEEDMLNFAWFLKENLGQYSCDEKAHFEGKYLEQFKKK